MSILVTTASGARLTLEDKPFGRGGEGAVHQIVHPAGYEDLCVKLYRTAKMAQEREQKVDYMIAHAPGNASLSGKHYLLCWPKEAVFQNNCFAGFLMPQASDDSEKLYELCTLHMRQLEGKGVWHQRYNRTTTEGLTARLKLCVNIAIAVNIIHKSGEYVLVDLKPDNFRVSAEGRVFVIDLDSIQITPGQNAAQRFHSRVCTPDHAPPESELLDPKTSVIKPSWDCFSLAVVFYELLFGVHPYAASFTNSSSAIHTTEAAISKGLFVHGRNKHEVLRMPLAHETFTRLPQPIKQLFLDAFDNGYTDPEVRPRAEQWGQVLYEAINKGITVTPVPMPQLQSPCSGAVSERASAPVEDATQGDGTSSISIAVAILVAVALLMVIIGFLA
jgi:DNA-binding helix-hairpin-helix protein with protein kinase domain